LTTFEDASRDAAAAPSSSGSSAAPSIALDDRLVRLVGIPAFGFVAPRMSGIFDGVPMSAPLYWVGTAWSVVAVAVICHGTRGAYLAQRRSGGTWMDHPLRKLVRLLAVILLFTVPPTVLSLAGWNALLGTAAWRAGLGTLALAVVGVVLMIYLYEFAFLLRERAAERARLLRLDRARAEAQLLAWGAQVDPHFLFNSLNTLGHLIATDRRRASVFTAHLAALHHYVLRSATTQLVSLDAELRFLQGYVKLMTIRFATAFEVTILDEGADRRWLLPPTALQVLVENAIKHNELGEARPLRVTVTLGAGAVVVENEHRPCRMARPSAGSGLRNLDERLQLTTGGRLAVARRDGTFVVTVPLAPPIRGSRPATSAGDARAEVGTDPEDAGGLSADAGSARARPGWIADGPAWRGTRINRRGA
jgi:Histidine kinase